MADAWRFPRPTAAQRAMRVMSAIETLLWWGVAFVLIPAFLLGSAWLMSLGTALLGFAFASRDLSQLDRNRVSAITVYSLSAGAIALANTVGLLAADGPRRPVYFVYAVDEHLMLATELALAGTLIPVLAFYAMERRPELRALVDMLPPVRGYIPDRNLVIGAAAASAFVLVTRLVMPLPKLGTLTGIFLMVPQLAVFTLARAATERRIKGALTVALLIAIADASYALLFDYLRANVAAPLAALVLGALFGARSLHVLKRKSFLPVYVAVAYFVIYFGAFAAARTTSEGLERISAASDIYADRIAGEQLSATRQQTVLSRLTNFNQLSQIGRVVQEDGYLEGQTMEYLAFAFVPRFLWPEKPTIAKGAWWALRIGQAHTSASGQITNSVNMTIPGELFLNFGWLGVFVGCSAFGALLGILWVQASFWSGSNNTLGTAFGFYLLWLWVGYSLGPDLQVMVTMIAMYLVFVLGGVMLSFVDRSRSPVTREQRRAPLAPGVPDRAVPPSN
jgi:hypothetical protein